MQHRLALNWLTCVVLAASAFGAASASAADAATKDRYDAAQKSAEADYKASVARCEDLKDNAKKVCVENAKGNEKVAKANAEADYSVAKLRCDDKKGNEKDVCAKDADAAKTKAYGDAKVMRTSRESSKDTATARQDANADANKAQYKAAVERCDSMTGNSKDACVADAKVRFNQ